ncbi:hybrid sensor histidine kinase/response regulator [Imhoffiella purpurea]|uniref:Chemotaxis protein CheA n=1 Tax=Imhoffiella purpurea TaxID=1249627 RepID=W9V8U1_9GAMM|nr:Hpt domain-containing protein [Imhoffiella purpurea]EXJ16023.1 Signal transduction histidine kinase CheA [Imhoffiella purpurea]
MADKTVVGGLKWVKNEIGVTLRPVRDLIEAGRAGDSAADLALASQALEQIHGVLLALQLSTPARLVEEMSHLVERMGDSDPDQVKQASDVMGQALIQLNGHLDRLDAGFDEPPLSLWSIINEVRSACDSLPLTHSELLTFAAVNADGDSQWMPEELDILAEVMRQVRPQFHRHLVEWFRSDPENQGLLHLSRLFHQLHDYLKEGLLADLFRLGEIYVEALRDGRVASGPQTRTLLGHLDWVLKPLVQKPPLWPEVDALTLIEQYISALDAARISSPEILQLRAYYGMGRSSAAMPATDSDGLGDEAALAELAANVLVEFAELKAIFDRMAQGGQPDQGDLDAFCSTLQRLAGLLDEVEVGNLPARMRSLADRFSASKPGLLAEDPERLESHAMELLGIEAVLLAYADHRDAESDQILAPDLDLSELTSATLREAGYEMLRVKDAVATWQSDPSDSEVLEPVRDHLSGVSGALRILGENSAADCVEDLAGLVERRYVHAGQRPAESELDHLADAIAAIELYVGHLQEPMPLGHELVERAGQAIRALRALPEVESSPQADSLEEIEPDTDHLLEPEFREQWPDTYAVEEESHGAAFSEPVAGNVETTAASEEIETEFLEIFMEEAREETEAAQAQFARWESNPYDADALGTLRRSFHTLKGSGRLVGAQQVAEFSQSLEYLLNRLIETKSFPSEEILACVADAVSALPDLVAAEGEGRPFDVEPMVARATALKDAIGQAPAAPEPAATGGGQPEVAEAAEDHDSLFADDDELLHIFQEETREHLSVVRDFLDRVDSDGAKVQEPVQRALHTLTGSARMSGIDSVARVAKGLELRIKPVLAAGSELDETLLSLLARLVSAVEARVEELPGAGDGAAALADLSAELDRLPPAEMPAAGVPTEVPDAEEPEPQGTGEVAEPQESEVEEAESTEERKEPSVEPEEIEEPVQAESVEPAQEPRPSAPRPAEPEPEPEAGAPEPLDAMLAPDPELAALFLEDARDLLDNLDTQFRDWLLSPQDTAALDGINRLLHTLKGSARLTGLPVIGDLSHALETRLKALGEGQGSFNDTTLELAQRAVDTLSVQVDALEQGAPIPRVAALVEALGRSADAPEETPDVALMQPTIPVEDSPRPETIAEVKRLAAEVLAEPGAARDGAAVAVSPQIRVRSDLLNRLVNHAGEISIYRGRLTQRNGQLGFGLSELDQTVVRLREQLRLLEIETQTQILHRFERSGAASEYDEAFDPLEFDRFSRLQQLSGSLAETVNDLVSVKEMLGGYQREFTDMLNQQARLADDLQDGLLRTRLIPFVQVVPRLHRLVRQTADSLGKSARLEVIGPEVELDRTILDRLVAPLEHLLRNAVDHGLEDPKTRVAKGKPATGMVTLALRREGNDAVISLSDDGKGMDLDAIRRQAIARGLMSAEASLPEEAMLQFILEPGFTTSGKVTQISGRGVGLDVVASEIKAANGTISLESSWGKGARFTIRLPLTLAIIEAFLVSAGENIYAVPHSTVEGAARISREDLAAVYHGEGKGFETRGHTYKVVYLGSVLEPGQEPELGERRWMPMLLARLGDQRVAFHVDTLIESQRILVKPLGPQLAGVRWLSGGTILPDGRVALILDALALLRSGALQEYHQAAVAAEPEHEGTCVMVVDDSLTVRRVTSRLLRRQNMEVLTAKDGVEALTLLDERIPDLILLDIEMPRMDGYELTRHIRRSERLHTLPIIMITSRTGTKHRDYAMQLGVNRYLGKPYQESELLKEISGLLSDHVPV